MTYLFTASAVNITLTWDIIDDLVRRLWFVQLFYSMHKIGVNVQRHTKSEITDLIKYSQAFLEKHRDPPENLSFAEHRMVDITAIFLQDMPITLFSVLRHFLSNTLIRSRMSHWTGAEIQPPQTRNNLLERQHTDLLNHIFDFLPPECLIRISIVSKYVRSEAQKYAKRHPNSFLMAEYTSYKRNYFDVLESKNREALCLRNLRRLVKMYRVSELPTADWHILNAHKHLRKLTLEQPVELSYTTLPFLTHFTGLYSNLVKLVTPQLRHLTYTDKRVSDADIDTRIDYAMQHLLSHFIWTYVELLQRPILKLARKSSLRFCRLILKPWSYQLPRFVGQCQLDITVSSPYVGYDDPTQIQRLIIVWSRPSTFDLGGFTSLKSIAICEQSTVVNIPPSLELIENIQTGRLICGEDDIYKVVAYEPHADEDQYPHPSRYRFTRRKVDGRKTITFRGGDREPDMYVGGPIRFIELQGLLHRKNKKIAVELYGDDLIDLLFDTELKKFMMYGGESLSVGTPIGSYHWRKLA